MNYLDKIVREVDFWGPIQYHIRRFIVGSRKVSKAQDRVLKGSYRFEI